MERAVPPGQPDLPIPVWIKITAGLMPMFLAALITVAWQNSHALAVLTVRIDDANQELLHQRQLIENRLNCTTPAPKP